MKPRSRIISLGLKLSILFASGCSTMLPGGSICTDRNGACFDATIDQQPVVPLTSRGKIQSYAMATESARIKADLGYVAWEVKNPVSGALAVAAAINKNGATWFGSGATIKVQVLPLNAQKLTTHATLTRADNVRIHGNPVLTQSNVIDQATLPPGDYLVKIRATGPSNWDSKMVLVTVK